MRQSVPISQYGTLVVQAIGSLMFHLRRNNPTRRAYPPVSLPYRGAVLSHCPASSHVTPMFNIPRVSYGLSAPPTMDCLVAVSFHLGKLPPSFLVSTAHYTLIICIISYILLLTNSTRRHMRRSALIRQYGTVRATYGRHKV